MQSKSNWPLPIDTGQSCPSQHVQIVFTAAVSLGTRPSVRGLVLKPLLHWIHIVRMLSGYHPIVQSLMGTLLTWGLTAAGSALVFVFQGGKVSLWFDSHIFT